MKVVMKSVNYLLDLLFPPRCTFCHCFLNNGEHCVCEKCINKLPYAEGNAQVQSFLHITKCVSPFYYEDNVRDSLLRYKFSGVAAYARVYADYLAKCIDENQVFCDIITWVPLSKKRLRTRGYDQAKLIAEAVADILGTDCTRLIVKKIDNPAQSGTGNLTRRKANVAGVYESVQQDIFEDKKILLIDDIVTTGSTLSECAGVLRASGAGKVYAAAVARKRD